MRALRTGNCVSEDIKQSFLIGWTNVMERLLISFSSRNPGGRWKQSGPLDRTADRGEARGEVGAECASGDGCRFWFTLPKSD
jgi:hypothetical protein